MEKQRQFVDIGEGISLKVTKDAEFTLVNNETGKTRTFVSSRGKLLVDDRDIDFNTIDETYGNRRYMDKYVRYGFHRCSNFKDGVCRLVWVIYPDGRYFADSDGYGMEDNDEERVICTIDRNFDIIEPFRPENNVPAEVKQALSANTSTVPDSSLSVEVNESNTTETSDASVLDIIAAIPSEEKIDTDEYIKSLEKCRDILNDRISSFHSNLEVKQFDGNVAAIRIGESYSLVNLKSGRSRMLVNKDGHVLLDVKENPLAQEIRQEEKIEDSGLLDITDITIGMDKYQEGERRYAYIPIKCIHVSKTGISLIEVQTNRYHEPDDIDYISVFEDNYIPVQHWLTETYFCLMDQDFNVVVPVSLIENPREFCESWPDIPTKEMN